MELPIPCEERLQTLCAKRRLTISIPRELATEDTRVPLTPQGVELLVAQGHTVKVEKGVGEAARFDDSRYAEAGATVVTTHKAAFDAEVVLKTTLPTVKEVSLMQKKASLICSISQLRRSKDDVQALAAKKCNVLALDFLTDGKSHQSLLRRSLSEIEGSMAITTAASLLQQTNEGKGIVIGGVTGVPPTEIVVVGSDLTAFSIAKIAQAFGSTVKIFDSDMLHLQQINERLPVRVFTSNIHPQAFNKALQSADVVIGTRSPSPEAFFVPAESIKQLKRHAIVIDLNINFGGRFEISHATTIDKPTFIYGGTICHCLPDITVLASHTASIVVSDFVAPTIGRIAIGGGLLSSIREDRVLASATAMLQGVTTNKYLAQTYDTDFCDIDLLSF